MWKKRRRGPVIEWGFRFVSGRDFSVFGKLFTRLDGWTEKYQIYIEAQNGFRRGRGTVDSTFIDDFLAQGKKLYAYFVDYSKDFWLCGPWEFAIWIV